VQSHYLRMHEPWPYIESTEMKCPLYTHTGSCHLNFAWNYKSDCQEWLILYVHSKQWWGARAIPLVSTNMSSPPLSYTINMSILYFIILHQGYTCINPLLITIRLWMENNIFTPKNNLCVWTCKLNYIQTVHEALFLLQKVSYRLDDVGL